MNSICFNGKWQPAEEPALLVSNRGYRYGDGLFETLKVQSGRIRLGDLHFDRLWEGMKLLQMEVPVLFTREKIEKEIMQLCRKNHCEKLARVRLSVFRGNGGLYDEDRSLQYVIECWPLNDTHTRLNTNGLVIGIFPDARKSCDKYAGIKSASFLPYSQAAIYARKQKWNDCLVLNSRDRIADSTIANIFLVKDSAVRTPGLEEGCVAGVMRRHLLESLKEAGYSVSETPLTPDDLAAADELFLSNAIRGISWVQQFGDRNYTNRLTSEIFNRFVATINT